MFKNRLGVSIAALSAMMAIRSAAQGHGTMKTTAQGLPRGVEQPIFCKPNSSKDRNSLGDVGGNRLSQKGIRRRARQAGVKVSKWKS